MTSSRTGWWLRRILAVGFLGLVAWLLATHARQIEWAEVRQAAGRYSVPTLLSAAALGLVSYGAYCSFDVIGKAYTGHDLPLPAVLLTTFISYAFNLNFGALVGGAGFRYRLYSRQGLRTADISRVLGLSMLANWSGYLPLIGIALLAGAVPVPDGWPLSHAALRAAGLLPVGLIVAYLAACAFSPRRRWSLRGHEIVLPSGAMAGLQLVISMSCWMAIAAVIHVLLWQQVAYLTVLGVMLMAAVAGVITHVPAGLGVLEAVFIAGLGGVVPRSELLAALLAYRAVYYLVPLGVAVLAFVLLEARLRSRAKG